MPTFDEFFIEHRIKPTERAALVWHLAQIRTRRLIETLLPEPAPFTPEKSSGTNE